MNIRKLSLQLHKWLGLFSGIVVSIVCITGCIYALKDEITSIAEPWRTVAVSSRAMLLPDRIISIANADSGLDSPSAVTYGLPDEAIKVDYRNGKESFVSVFVNPYSGDVLKKVEHRRGDTDFFAFILKGHRSLWIPGGVGKTVIGCSVLVFVLVIIAGIVMWLPKKWNRKTLRSRFVVKKGITLSGLHSIIGCYVAIVLLVVSLTGLIWSFDWFSKAVYGITSGGKPLMPYTLPKSDIANVPKTKNSIDDLYLQLRKDNPDAASLYFALPESESGVIRVSVEHEKGSYYKTDNLFFDQYTLEPLSGSGPYAGRYSEASVADKLRRMNLDIHDGRIFGTVGRIVVFICALIGALLPITGVIIFLRKWKRVTPTGRGLA